MRSKDSIVAREPREFGGAVVETAIMSLIMVPLAIYAIFMYEYAMINLKASEAARYAAWEMTAMQMSDYKSYKHLQDGYLSGRMDSLKQEVRERWGDDMNSATASSESEIFTKSRNTLFAEKHAGLIVTKFDGGGNETDGAFLSIDITDDSPYGAESNNAAPPPDAEPANQEDGAGGIFGGALGSFSGILSSGTKGAYNYLKFNTNGFVSTELGVQMAFSHSAPIYKGEGMYLGSDGGAGTLPKLKGKEKLLADAWDLKNGGNVDRGQEVGPSDSSAGEEYHNQVSKLVFMGLTAAASNWLGDLGNDAAELLDTIGFRDPFATVARSFALKHATNGSGINSEGALSFGDKRIDPFSGKGKGDAPSKFYTNTFKDTWVKTDSPYFKVYQKQSPSGQSASDKTTGYYMGCDKPQIVNRADCWR